MHETYRKDNEAHVLGDAPEQIVPTRHERRDATQNRQRILDTARRLFNEQGVDSTSMNQIAQVADVGPGTLYRNYAHKGALCLALLADDIAAFKERVAPMLHGAESALSRLDMLLNELLHMTQSHIPLMAGVQEAFAGERRHDLYQSPFYTWLHERISALLHEGVEQGEIVPLDVAFTADAILAVVAPPLLAFQQQGRGFDHARITAGVRRLFIDGLRVREP